MQRRTFVLRLAEGMEQEYIRRHNEIWPEMISMLQQAGISNYSIWVWENMLIGYFQSDDLEKTDAFKAKCEVQKRWEAYMSDIISSRDKEGQLLSIPQCVFVME